MSSANSSDCDTTRPCSYCKRDVAVANFVLHEAHCMRHIALCPQCKEPVPKAQLKEHVAQEHSKVPCELCEKEFERHELEDHKANNCHQRPVTCQFCEIELPMSKMPEHEDACGSRTEKCLTCQSYIMIKHAEEHKMSNCRPPEEEQDWEPEEERPHKKFGYVDEYDRYPVNEYDRYPVNEYAGYPVNEYDRYPVNEYNGFPVNKFDDHDDMVPCEFCGMPFPFDYLIQHESGCDQNAMLGNAPPAPAHQPRQLYPPEDVQEDGTRNTVPELKDLNINPTNKERKNVVENSRKPEDQEHRLPSKQKPSAARAPPPTAQTEKSTVEKMNTDMSKTNLDSESVHNATSTAKENYASGCDVIPCEFCDCPIELMLLMEHQKMCRWVHSNKAFRQEPHFAVNGENEDDFDESPTRYQHRFQRGRGYTSPSRGYTNGNTKWTSERNSHAASTSKYPYNTEKRSYREVANDPDNSASETSSYQSRSQGRSGYRSYHQEDRRQTYADDEPNRYKGRMEHDRGSRWQREEQTKVRPLMDFDVDDLRQEGQREEKRPARQQREDNRWSKGQREDDRWPKGQREDDRSSKGQHEDNRWPKGQYEDNRYSKGQREDNRWPKGQQEQRDKPSERRQVRNENPRAVREESDVPTGQRPESANVQFQRPESANVQSQRPESVNMQSQRPESANLRLEGRIGAVEEQKKQNVAVEEEKKQNGAVEEQKKIPGYQPQRKQEQVGVGQLHRTHGADNEDETGVQPEEENWRGNRPTVRGRFSSRGGGERPDQSRSNLRSHGDAEENETVKEPAANARTAERTRGGQTQQNLRHDEEREARSSRGRGGRPDQSRNNTRSHGDADENETVKEPTTNTRTAERTRRGQTRETLRHDEGREARPRKGDDQGQAWSGRRGQVRGRYNWRRERWNRAKGQAEEDCYSAPWPRRSNRDQNE